MNKRDVQGREHSKPQLPKHYTIGKCSHIPLLLYGTHGHLELSEDASSRRHVVLFYSVPVSNSSLIAFVGFFFFVSYFPPTKTTTNITSYTIKEYLSLRTIKAAFHAN